MRHASGSPHVAVNPADTEVVIGKMRAGTVYLFRDLYAIYRRTAERAGRRAEHPTTCLGDRPRQHPGGARSAGRNRAAPNRLRTAAVRSRGDPGETFDQWHERAITAARLASPRYLSPEEAAAELRALEEAELRPVCIEPPAAGQRGPHPPSGRRRMVTA
jgi:hypothetical protein